MNIQETHITGMTFRCRADAALTFSFVDENARKVTGYSETELVETGLFGLPDLIQPDIREAARKQIQGGISGRRVFAFPVPLYTKNRFPADGILIGKGFFTGPLTLTSIEGYLLIMTPGDKMAVSTLDQSTGPLNSDFWKKMLDYAGEIIAYISFDTTIHYISPAINRILGFEAEAVLAGPFTRLLMSYEKERFEDMCNNVHKQGNSVNNITYSAKNSEGKRVGIQVRIYVPDKPDTGLILTASPSPGEQPGIFSSEDRFMEICDLSPFPLIITGRNNWRIITANTVFSHLTGRTKPDEVIGLTMTSAGILVSDDDLLSLVSDRETDSSFTGKEIPVSTPGGIIPVLLSVKKISSGGKEALSWSLVPVPGKEP